MVNIFTGEETHLSPHRLIHDAASVTVWWGSNRKARATFAVNKSNYLILLGAGLHH